MKTNPKFLTLLLVTSIFGAIGYVVWQNASARASPAEGRKAVFYQDSMHPWVKSDQPGKCTICAMDLTPIFEGEKGFGVAANLVVLSSNNITVLNVQTEEVKRQPLVRTLRVAGTLEANETRKTVISALAAGRIENLTVPYVGVEVQEGQPLFSFFSPELWAKQRNLVAVFQVAQEGGLPEKVLPLGSDIYYSTQTAPRSGLVIERNVYDGQYVDKGERLFTLVDSSNLWFRFDVYERQLAWIAEGQPIDVTALAVPGRKFPAAVTFIDPTFGEATRTVKVRANVPNPVVDAGGRPQRLLRFGMYAEGHMRSEVPNVLTVPRTAILFPGAVAYAYVDKSDGAYERRRLKLGRQGDELWEVLQGLEEGERVVASGNVLIDAQAQFNQSEQSDEPIVSETASDEPAGGATDAGGAMSPTAPKMPDDSEEIQTSNPPRLASDVDMTLGMDMTPGDEMALVEVHPTNDAPGPEAASAVENRAAAARDARYANYALREKMWKKRQAIAEANQTNKVDSTPLSANQSQALADFLAAAAGISQALAADDLEQFNRHITNLPGALSPLQNEFGEAHRWSESIQRLAALNQEQPAKDLDEARRQFLPFSATAVELAKQLRKEDPAFAELKIYHCPMAPKPGLWIQAKGPLANPFYGAKMLKCGEEVKP
jgi:Cu(I)/Ag(I) efflux system membrane fusion protein